MGTFLATVNWRTAGYGVGYVVCTLLVSRLVPSLAELCEIIDKLIIGAAFVSSADAARVRSVVRTVDVLAFKNKIDPALLVSFDEGPSTVKVP
jgi:hypothetical protein